RDRNITLGVPLMANSEKLLYTCRSAMPSRPRACYGMTFAGCVAVTVRAWRSSGGTVRQAVLTPGETAARRTSSGGLVESARSGDMTLGCLAVQESLTLWLHSPLTSRAKAEKVLPSLLDIQLPFPVEDCLYRFVEFRRTSEGTVSALVCAARREAIKNCLERYQAQGTDPMLLDHEGLALWTQSLVEWPAFAPGATAGRPVEPRCKQASYRVLICLANDHATLVIGCGERYGNAHSLQMTASNDELVNRLQLILHAGLPAGIGVQWLFCGARAGEAAVIDALHRSLSLVWPGPLTLMAEPESFLARALCTRALKRGPLRCNLRQQTFTHSAVRRAADRSARAAAVGILIAGILLVGFSLTSRLLGERRLNRVKSEIAAVAGELAPGVTIPYGREIPEVQKAWEKQAPQIAPFLDAFTPSLAVRLAKVIKAGQASAVRFETLSLRRNSLILTGVTEDWDQCGQLEQRLMALGYTVKLERQEAVAETEVRFTVNAEGGGP
ncbi:MAG: hypothetical protein KJ692_03365, partial [Verrucomicrobia bacterium]|nr:hypothetical protein [Verrucomicrobiota bacterium]